MILKITELYILCGNIQVSTEKKKQFSIEMISKMTEPCILCGDIHIPTENSVQHWHDFKDQRTLHPLWGDSNPNPKTQFISKWLQRWKTLTFFVGAFKFQLTEPYIFVGTFKLEWKKQFSIQMISKMTDPYIVCGNIQIPVEKAVQYRNDFKDDRTLHPLLGYSSSNWKGQFSIEMTL